MIDCISGVLVLPILSLLYYKKWWHIELGIFPVRNSCKPFFWCIPFPLHPKCLETYDMNLLTIETFTSDLSSSVIKSSFFPHFCFQTWLFTPSPANLCCWGWKSSFLDINRERVLAEKFKGGLVFCLYSFPEWDCPMVVGKFWIRECCFSDTMAWCISKLSAKHCSYENICGYLPSYMQFCRG